MTVKKPPATETASALVFRLPWPPSINGYWRRWENRTLISKRGREFREAVLLDSEVLAARRHFKQDQRLQVVIVLTPPTRAKRDIDNHVKAILDALEQAQVFVDDSQIDDLFVSRAPVCENGAGCADVVIQAISKRGDDERNR